MSGWKKQLTNHLLEYFALHTFWKNANGNKKETIVEGDFLIEYIESD